MRIHIHIHMTCTLRTCTALPRARLKGLDALGTQIGLAAEGRLKRAARLEVLVPAAKHTQDTRPRVEYKLVKHQP
jgi:hypothetical protein